MRIRFNYTLISAIVLSFFLTMYIPGGLKYASTWRELYFQTPGYKEQNLLMPLGIHWLGFALTGLVVLWTGYIKKERWAWFVMLIILLFFIFPHLWLSVLIEKTLVPGPSRLFSVLAESRYFRNDIRSIFALSPLELGFVLNLLSFPVMLIALLIPIKSFFWKSANSKAVD